MLIPDDLLRAIEDFRYKHRYPTRTEADQGLNPAGACPISLRPPRGPS